MHLRPLHWLFTGGQLAVAVAMALAVALVFHCARSDQARPIRQAARSGAATSGPAELVAAEAGVAPNPTGSGAASSAGAPSARGQPQGPVPATSEKPPVKQAPEEKPLTWERPRFQERKAERLRMVAGQIEARGVKDGAVVEAMREVPRHRFVPDNRQGAAYADGPQPIGYGQTISQPYVVALMTELLNLKPGDRVLEIGTGSGYQAAVLSELTPCVYTVEILPELAQQAADRLRKLGYKTVETRQSDGYYGWKEHAPFDAIIVTAAAGHVPPPLIEQLKPGGRIVVPIGGVYETQDLVVVTKDMDGRLRTRSVLPVTFVPMTGEVQKEK